MIYKTIKSHDPSIRYDQTNNIIERFLKDLKSSSQIKFWLESCNVEASCCAVEAVGGLFTCPLPVIKGQHVMGYGDLMFAFLYSDYGQKNIPVNMNQPDNEFVDNLAFAINNMTNVKARVNHNKAIVNTLKQGNAVVLCYETDYKSGHYITLVQYNTEANMFMGYDSWADNIHCKNKGVMEYYTFDFINSRMRPWHMEVGNELR